MSKQYYKVCCCCGRMFRPKAAQTPEYVKAVFDSYSDNGTMKVDQLLVFLREFQGETESTQKDAQAIFDSLKHLNIFQRRELHLEAFLRYLLGDLNPPLPPNLGVHHDMEAPLAHYFMYTGHNSYLTGNQVTSDCSTEPIIRALRRGVRVIELDLWPSTTKQDEVDVRHGGTLTTPVELMKCLEAIKENAFVASQYPVVITFEDHLNSDLQAKVASMVQKVFGSILYCPGSGLKELPSPASLMKRILISTKPPKEYLETDGKPKRNPQKNSPAKEEPSGEENQKDNEEADDGEEHQDEDLQHAVPEYRHLIAIHAGKQKGGITKWFFDDPNKAKRISLSEQELEGALEMYATDIVRFTQRNLLRVYPKGTRLNSSNYDPITGWMHGAQMVAFNMQGYGKYLWIMQGMFRANGGCGYVKKPEFMLDPINVFDPRDNFPVRTILKVKVLMGDGWHLDFSHNHFDLYSPPDFYARVGIAGIKLDSVMKRTKAIEDEWIPVWNEEFEFPLRIPELALLRIEVMEYDTTGRHDFGGQTCLPVSELRTGIRSVPLYSRRGDKYKSVRLLMHFDFIYENIYG
ncbi:phosphoinositide phospholipase C 2-like isoform X2 [Diospyros lotus]|uniref:phosphoinositide phospholipase C 2-like isoform X2 n=1 Tax=Diospyros lotus TaxID=55363 RepID=UPI00224D9FBD|nr:phosphoinositide phospholipase C 2-like isoform X2 [Diospyros lotus]